MLCKRAYSLAQTLQKQIVQIHEKFFLLIANKSKALESNIRPLVAAERSVQAMSDKYMVK